MSINMTYLKKIWQYLTLPARATVDPRRRQWVNRIIAGSGIAGLGLMGNAQAHQRETSVEVEERFPGDPPQHFIVYPFNRADNEYHEHVLGSAGAMIAKYEDNIDQVLVCFGKGIHVLAKNPARPVSDEVKARIQSLAKQGVKFHACNRTLTSMQWTQSDLFPFVKIVDVGAADIMELQEKNYALMVW